ncbi:hypothetical protein K2X92_05530, partial [Candidatus Gracilibacteria bacterium]|nr:hypothetical protein [Candidatus Gracilibacteria bacterium]
RKPHIGAPISINGLNSVNTNVHGIVSLKEYIGHKIEDLVINGYKVNLVNIPDSIKRINTQTRLIFQYTMKSGHEVGEIIDSNSIPLTHHG